MGEPGRRGLELLERALRESPLPDESPDAEQLERWLIDFRRRELRPA